jgi:hypothetical protein
MSNPGFVYEKTFQNSKLFIFGLTVLMIITFTLGVYLSSLIARFLRLSYRGHRWCLRPVTLIFTLFLASPIALLLSLFDIISIPTMLGISGLGYLFGEPTHNPLIIIWAAVFWWLFGSYLEMLFADWAFTRTIVLWARWNNEDVLAASIAAAEADDEWRTRCWVQANTGATLLSCMALVGSRFAGRWLVFSDHTGTHQPTAFFRFHFLETRPVQ